MRCRKIQHLSSLLPLAAAILPLSTIARPFDLILSQDDLSDPAAAPNYPSGSDDVMDFDYFPEWESKPDSVLDPGSWSPLFESDPNLSNQNLKDEVIYYDGVRKMVEAASTGGIRIMEEAVADIEASAAARQPQGQLVFWFLYSMGMGEFIYIYTQHEKGGPLPKFGECDVNNPASADGFTVIFAKARDEKKATGTAAGTAAPPPPPPTVP